MSVLHSSPAFKCLQKSHQSGKDHFKKPGFSGVIHGYKTCMSVMLNWFTTILIVSDVNL